MPLSEHEQRMLDQIESALYAEDPKFASTVRGSRLGMASNRRRLQAGALFVLGLTLLIAGVALPLKPGGFPIISLLGFLVMFAAGVLLLLGGRRPSTPGATGGSSGSGKTGRSSRGGKKSSGGGFTNRMEERFRRRFEQD
ncbi:Protein of unknown function [Rhodococcus rhodochrous J3]|uniref:DUF3040 domain-containing protein n=3 Tax=Rhodococcus TaxID=1827 RepID=A0A6I6YEK5_RHORH|nr:MULTISPECIES: DUF3040 domain-containing protein [Rhodococcus]KSZ57556.1 membrane protein [Rhodococcus pyridinivorans KG-16]MBF4477053.1 DUF3040 domain-containing protein [Rhodococcus rhodochrous]MBS9371681.1 hypothetical protein [Rhodococcus sp. B50]MCB8908908.1 DUF3040 domain-containing protein [Rhodococcus rhodochrous]MCD2096105.1 DUF3040 domain-containing protein [Rhodococcus rhodochrous]